jgi:hypothetical protein
LDIFAVSNLKGRGSYRIKPKQFHRLTLFMVRRKRTNMVGKNIIHVEILTAIKQNRLKQ